MRSVAPLPPSFPPSFRPFYLLRDARLLPDADLQIVPKRLQHVAQGLLRPDREGGREGEREGGREDDEPGGCWISSRPQR